MPDRFERIGQVHPAALHRSARASRRWPDPARRRGHHGQAGQRQRGAPPDRDRVPVVQPVPPHEDHGQRHPRPPQGPGDGPRRGRGAGCGAAGQARAGRARHQVPRAALRRPAAARGHRPGTGVRARGAPPGRHHVGPRPRPGGRGPVGHPGPRRRAGAGVRAARSDHPALCRAQLHRSRRGADRSLPRRGAGAGRRRVRRCAPPRHPSSPRRSRRLDRRPRRRAGGSRDWDGELPGTDQRVRRAPPG